MNAQTLFAICPKERVGGVAQLLSELKVALAELNSRLVRIFHGSKIYRDIVIFEIEIDWATPIQFVEDIARQAGLIPCFEKEDLEAAGVSPGGLSFYFKWLD